MLKQDQNLTKSFCTSLLFCLKFPAVVFQFYLTWCSLAPVPISCLLLGTMDSWHTCSCFKYTCIILAVPSTPTPPPPHTILTYTWRSERMKWQSGEESSFLQIYSLSFAQSLINLFWFLLFSKQKEKKISLAPTPIYNGTWTGSGQLANSQGYSCSRLWLLNSTCLEGGWPDPPRDPQGHQAQPFALSAYFCHVHVAGMSWAVKQDSHQFINITVEYYRFFF